MFCHFRAKERAGYATVLHCRTKQKYGQQANEVAALTNQSPFRTNFSRNKLLSVPGFASVTKSTLIVSFVLFSPFTHSLSDR